MSFVNSDACLSYVPEPSGPFFCMPCGSASFSDASSGACPTGSCSGSGILLVLFLLFIVLTYLFFIVYCPHYTVGFAGYQFVWGLQT